VLTLTVLLTAALVDSGRIVRTWRRRGGGGVLRRQSTHAWSPFQYWTRYFRRAPRIIRRPHHHIPAPLLPHHAQESPQQTRKSLTLFNMLSLEGRLGVQVRRAVQCSRRYSRTQTQLKPVSGTSPSISLSSNPLSFFTSTLTRLILSLSRVLAQ